MINRRLVVGSLAAFASTGLVRVGQSQSTEALIAHGGRANLPVVISENASVRVHRAAKTLAQYLGRITGAGFEVIQTSSQSGIFVGLLDHFPNAGLREPNYNDEPTRREEYLLRSTPDRVFVIGTTELAVENAVWDLLYRVGYRQYFPGETWEILPKRSNLSIAVEAMERPAFYGRRIWYGFGPWDYAKAPYADWCAKNRMVAGITLNTGHAYGAILKRNKEEFAKHPEYLGLVDGQRTSDKFCISNPGLRDLVVADAVRQFSQNPEIDSISLEPSDGGNWCECDPCAKLGSISDRVILLANEVAAAVDKIYPGKLVGIYAYHLHSPPPSLDVHPQVVVSVATAFIKKSGMSVEDLLESWSRKARWLGIREYYSVTTWDRDLPGKARGGNLDYLARTISRFHENGVRFISAESSDNWGPNGLGYYFAARSMWNIQETENKDEIVEEFLANSFGNAKEPMREFYRQLDGSTARESPLERIGVMFRSLHEAMSVADTVEIKARLNDLILYARYVDLFHRYMNANKSARQDAFEALIRHAYRMRKTMLVHVKALYRDIVRRDKLVYLPVDAEWDQPEGINPWKSSQLFESRELARFLTEGMERYPDRRG